MSLTEAQAKKQKNYFDDLKRVRLLLERKHEITRATIALSARDSSIDSITLNIRYACMTTMQFVCITSYSVFQVQIWQVIQSFKISSANEKII